MNEARSYPVAADRSFIRMRTTDQLAQLHPRRAMRWKSSTANCARHQSMPVMRLGFFPVPRPASSTPQSC